MENQPTVTFEEVWRLVELMKEEDRERLKATLLSDRGDDDLFWKRVDERAARLAQNGAVYPVEEWIRRDRDGR